LLPEAGRFCLQDRKKLHSFWGAGAIPGRAIDISERHRNWTDGAGKEGKMTRYLKLVSLAAICILALAAPAFGAKGGNGGGGAVATIAFATPPGSASTLPSHGSQVNFAVTANVKPSQLYSLWVANICSQNGVTVSAEYHPVSNSLAGPFTLGSSGEQCTAYVWLFPDAWTPLSGGSMTYSVS
jgi:hypothetical protein